ncbi:jg19503 [Pararge aegeria aegeria]|uniref:Jg19503 protein n=1 Tax=Pararge aegeria aegeria TaxID=348720 RepID=A0A8S4S703_9NEOP|nr:jg19503 [Pararge aegeria aegeria]
MSAEDIKTVKKPETSQPRRRPKKLVIPKRAPSIVAPKKLPVFITPDKTTCLECPCFPKEDPYDKNKKLNPCQKSPVSLYEMASAVVDKLDLPAAFDWTEDDVARWMEDDVGFPQYKACILRNHINGKRLITLEDPSKLAELNIRDFGHIQTITSKLRRLFNVEFVRFARSIGLPPRKPLTHCTWFKSRTGPSWGVRQNWTRKKNCLLFAETPPLSNVRLDEFDSTPSPP